MCGCLVTANEGDWGVDVVNGYLSMGGDHKSGQADCSVPHTQKGIFSKSLSSIGACAGYTSKLNTV